MTETTVPTEVKQEFVRCVLGGRPFKHTAVVGPLQVVYRALTAAQLEDMRQRLQKPELTDFDKTCLRLWFRIDSMDGKTAQAFTNSPEDSWSRIFGSMDNMLFVRLVEEHNRFVDLCDKLGQELLTNPSFSQGAGPT